MLQKAPQCGMRMYCAQNAARRHTQNTQAHAEAMSIRDEIARIFVGTSVYFPPVSFRMTALRASMDHCKQKSRDCCLVVSQSRTEAAPAL
ncbi:hypothetical protein CBOM_08062 [Ceraceosorus bombacis]|uniref:Uncharacterized protein n=1 Tax=Ceraceosorus bombacis TaxID=401625 RepID=A0A0N7LBH0_9BASI|nr:hypothetical protein CBOM_08062 [Ceraceosorus bombacis]